MLLAISFGILADKYIVVSARKRVKTNDDIILEGKMKLFCPFLFKMEHYIQIIAPNQSKVAKKGIKTTYLKCCILSNRTGLSMIANIRRSLIQSGKNCIP